MDQQKSFPDWIICPTCDYLHLRPKLKEGDIAVCKRCGTRLVGRYFLGSHLPMALILSALAVYLVAINLPFISLGISGQTELFTLPASVSALLHHRMWFLACLVTVFLILAPFFSILILLYLLFFITRGEKPFFYIQFLKLLSRFHALDMTDVYLASIFVVLVKTTDMGDIGLGPGFWAFCAQVLFIRFAFFFMPIPDLWQTIHPPTQVSFPLPEKSRHAREAGFLACHICGLVHLMGTKHCKRCNTASHVRKPWSIDKTLALVLAALVLYIPANVYPMMVVESMGETTNSTILEGVVIFWQEGSWFIAFVIFFASIAIPIAKLLFLSYLVIRVKFFRSASPMDETKIYKITEWIGKWSLIDVFVVATMAAMVQMGRFVTIAPGEAVVSFALVVIITLFAAKSFDSKLLWDNPSPVREKRT